MANTTFAPAPEQEDADPRRWLALAVIAIAQLMIVLDATIVTIALPTAQQQLHISNANRQWVVTGYTLTFGGLLLLGGRLSDFVGRKRVLIIGLIGFASASALGGLAQNGVMLFAARALQGSFGAVMAPASLAIMTVTFTEAHERAKAFGVYAGISAGGAAIGLIMGGILTDYASWRWCLLVNVPVSIVAAVSAIAIVHESKATGDTRYDIPGAITATGGLVALVYGFTRAGESSWTATSTLVSLGVAVVLLGAFVFIESRSEDPLLPMRVVLDRNRGGAFLASLIAGCAMLGMFLFLTFYLQGTLHYSPLKTGFAFMPFTGGIAIGAGIASKMLPRVGPRVLMVGGFLAATLGIIWLTGIGVSSGYVSHVLVSQIIMSIGFGFVFVPMSSTALIGVEHHDAGVASATLNATQQVGGSLGTGLLNAIATSATAGYLAAHDHASSALPAALVHGYKIGFSVSAGLLGLATLVAFFVITASRDEVANFDPTAVLA